jgi:hypothetical protein
MAGQGVPRVGSGHNEDRERKEPTMIHVIRADERHFTDFDWLKTYWLFSFSEYYDQANIQFGALRV